MDTVMEKDRINQSSVSMASEPVLTMKQVFDIYLQKAYKDRLNKGM